MRLGSTVEGGPAPAPASKVTSKGGCCEVEEGAGQFGMELFLSCCFYFPVFSKPLLESKIGCVISLFLE